MISHLNVSPHGGAIFRSEELPVRARGPREAKRLASDTSCGGDIHAVNPLASARGDIPVLLPSPPTRPK